MVCSNNDSILHRFRDITTFIVYVTSVTLRSWEVLQLNKTVEITTMYAFWFICEHIVGNTYYISWDMGVRKVSNKNWHLRSLRDIGTGAIW